MTDLTTENGRFGELEALDGGNGYDNDENHAGQDEEDEQIALVRVIQVKARELRYLLFQ